MSKPLIDLPSSISADGWADDLFKAAGTRPDPTVKAPPPPPIAGPSSSSSSTIHGSRAPAVEYKPTSPESRPSVTNGRGNTTDYSSQTMPPGGLAATLSYPGHNSFSSPDEDGRLKVCPSDLYHETFALAARLERALIIRILTYAPALRLSFTSVPSGSAVATIAPWAFLSTFPY